MIKERKGLERILFWLYEGFGTGPYVFRWVLLALDAASVAFFLWAPFQERTVLFFALDIVFAIYIGLDIAARFWIARSRTKFVLNPLNIADLVVLGSLLLPMFFSNLAFLRILRALRLVRAFTFLRRMKDLSDYLDRNAEIIDRVVNLLVFILIMTALVYVTQVNQDNGINSYLDAMYFTIASLTTTGYGDMVLSGTIGKILSMVIMVLGISLFLRLVQAIVRPSKLKVKCHNCGLARHEPDALFCKHCGTPMVIEKTGEA